MMVEIGNARINKYLLLLLFGVREKGVGGNKQRLEFRRIL
jgi:hypothetical protein